jgi:diaminohydroxyphosphoribosylaminopyrimidine deaminase/5-amino-6-(5-phosphoribosylamino)uracil reductase
MIDPNPHVSGGGIRALRRAGLDVATGLLEPQARTLNEAFIKHVSTGMPFVTLKIAQTLDGKIATASGESKWITGEKAREEGHRLRDSNDAVLVGINTVLKDDPSLTARIPKGRDPIRVVLDSRLRIPLNAKILAQKSSAKTIVATLATAPKTKIKKLHAVGAEVLFVKSSNGHVDLRDLMKNLGRKDIVSVLIEGGAEVHASAIRSGIADKVVFFVAPMLMTGRDSLCSIGGISPLQLSQAVRLRDVTSHSLGEDLMIEGYIR